MKNVISVAQLDKVVDDMDTIVTFYMAYRRFGNRGELPITVHLYLEKLISVLLMYIKDLGVEAKIVKK